MACRIAAAQNAAVSDANKTGTFQSVRGLVVVLALVVVGIGFGSQWWKADELRETQRQIQEAIASAPTTKEGKLEVWVTYANPQIHSCLMQMRLAPDLPWLVTHAVRTPGEDDVEFHGLDLTWIPKKLAVRDGLVARVRLPQATAVGRGPLTGDMARYVQVFGEGMRVPDPNERLQFLVMRAFGELPAGLQRDLEFATFELEIGDETSWEELGHVRPANDTSAGIPGHATGNAAGNSTGEAAAEGGESEATSQ